MAPRTPKALVQLARDFQIGVFEAHMTLHPKDDDVLTALGHLLTKSRRYADGLKADQRLVELLPDEPVAHYNLACSWALTGQSDQALACLRTALDMGYRDVAAIRRDADLRILRDDPRFEALLASVSTPGT